MRLSPATCSNHSPGQAGRRAGTRRPVVEYVRLTCPHYTRFWQAVQRF